MKSLYQNVVMNMPNLMKFFMFESSLKAYFLIVVVIMVSEISKGL